MSLQLQAALPQLISILPTIPGFDVLMSLVMVKITAFVIVFTTLVAGGILSRLVRTAITDGLHGLTYWNMINYRNALKKIGKEEDGFLLQCNNFDDLNSKLSKGKEYSETDTITS